MSNIKTLKVINPESKFFNQTFDVWELLTDLGYVALWEKEYLELFFGSDEVEFISLKEIEQKEEKEMSFSM